MKSGKMWLSSRILCSFSSCPILALHLSCSSSSSLSPPPQLSLLPDPPPSLPQPSATSPPAHPTRRRPTPFPITYPLPPNSSLQSASPSLLSPVYSSSLSSFSFMSAATIRAPMILAPPAMLWLAKILASIRTWSIDYQHSNSPHCGVIRPD